VQAVYRSYETTKLYRDLKLRGAIIKDKSLIMLPGLSFTSTFPLLCALSALSALYARSLRSPLCCFMCCIVCSEILRCHNQGLIILPRTSRVLTFFYPLIFFPLLCHLSPFALTFFLFTPLFFIRLLSVVASVLLTSPNTLSFPLPRRGCVQ
jgi:hypothetical protein